MKLYSVEFAEFGVEVFHQRLVRERLAGYLLDQILGPVTLSVLMDILLQPAEKLREITGGELRIEIAEILPGLSEKLSGIEVAQGIGGEIADQSGRPVDVLEAAFFIVGGFYAEIFFEFFIPYRGNIIDRDVTIEKGDT